MNIVWKRRLVRLFFFFAVPIRRVYRFFVRKPILAAKCLVECGGEFLLVRNSYAHRRWGVAGGGLNRGESYRTAAVRELFEETGIVAGRIEFLGFYTGVFEKCPVITCVYLCRVKNKDFAIDGLEISEAGWFTPDALPSPSHKSVDTILGMYKNLRKTPTK